MSMVLNEEQSLLKDTIKGFLNAEAPVEAMREIRDSQDAIGYKPQLWQALSELGLPATVIDEAYGGLSFGYLGMGAALEEMGRTLTASPMFSTSVLGASLIELAGSDEQKQQLLPELAAGNLTVALAIDEGLHHAPLSTELSIDVQGEALVLNGKKTFVPDGHSADKLIVVGRSAGESGEAKGLSLVLLDRASQGVTVQRTTMMDGRNAANISFDQVSVSSSALLGELHRAARPLLTTLDRGAICMAAEMLGGSTELFERTLEFIKEREQFGVKIGSFQALQHRCAKMFCELERCKSAVLSGLSDIDENVKHLAVSASLAKTLANDCYQLISNEAIQLHGGMGITDELEIGLFLKRARVCMQILGDSNYHRDRYASMLGY